MLTLGLDLEKSSKVILFPKMTHLPILVKKKGCATFLCLLNQSTQRGVACGRTELNLIDPPAEPGAQKFPANTRNWGNISDILPSTMGYSNYFVSQDPGYGSKIFLGQLV